MPRYTALQHIWILTMAQASAHLPNKLTEAARLAVSIGGFSFGMWCAKDLRAALDPEHERFQLAELPECACHFELDIAWADRLTLPSGTPSFSSGGLWSAFVSETGTKFYFASPSIGPAPYKAAWFDPMFERGHVVLNRSSFPAGRACLPAGISLGRTGDDAPPGAGRRSGSSCAGPG